MNHRQPETRQISSPNEAIGWQPPADPPGYPFRPEAEAAAAAATFEAERRAFYAKFAADTVRSADIIQLDAHREARQHQAPETTSSTTQAAQ